jgi:hypothetical protein
MCTITVNPQNARPRYWFIVLSRCNPLNTSLNVIIVDRFLFKTLGFLCFKKETIVNYMFNFYNGGDTFLNNFSFDEVGKTY